MGKRERLTRPPPKNKMDIATCSKSTAVHAPPQLARCSRNTLEVPYKKMTKDSTNAAGGTLDFHLPTTSTGGLLFQAQPRSAQHPRYRPSVNRPYQKKIPPLIKCASPLNTCLPLYKTSVSITEVQRYERKTRDHKNTKKKKKKKKDRITMIPP